LRDYIFESREPAGRTSAACGARATRGWQRRPRAGPRGPARRSTWTASRGRPGGLIFPLHGR